MLKLYGSPPTRALRVMWILNELGLEYEQVPVDLLRGDARKAAFLALNPAAKVPVLVDGERVLTESVAIQLYLAEKHPKAGLIPATVEDRAEMYRWLFFTVTEIEQPLWRIARHTFLYPEPRRLPADVEIATEECRAMLRIVERHLERRDVFVGERLSVADFNAAYLLDWADEAGMLGDSPRLQEWRRAMYARPTAPPTIGAVVAGAS